MKGPLMLQLYPSDLAHSSRLFKTCRVATATGCFGAVVALGVRTPTSAAHEERDGFSIRRHRRWGARPRGPLGKIVAMLTWYAAVLWHWSRRPVGMVSCHSVTTLPLGFLLRIATGATVVYEPHELETETWYTRGIVKRVYRWLERRLAPRAAGMAVVSDSIADWYVENYGLPRPVIVRNIPQLAGRAPLAKDSPLRARLDLGPEEILFIYQGALQRARPVEELLRVFERVRPDRHLVVMGFGELEEEVRAAARRSPNIHFVPAVPPAEVLTYTAGADVGIVGGLNLCLSYYLSLPNKLQEYLQAGLPVIVKGWPEMRRAVDEHGCGWIVADGAEACVELVDRLTRTEIAAAARRARAAAATFRWADEAEKLDRLYRAAAKADARQLSTQG